LEYDQVIEGLEQSYQSIFNYYSYITFPSLYDSISESKEDTDITLINILKDIAICLNKEGATFYE